MSLSTSDVIALISAVFSFFALLIAIIVWLFPRAPKKKKIPEFEGEINKLSASKFANFLWKNNQKIVKIRAYIHMDQDEIINAHEDDEHYSHSLTLKDVVEEEGGHSSVELGIRPERGSKSSPMVFANGSYHLNGFFIVEHHPGMRQGFIAASITEVSAEQMALRG